MSGQSINLRAFHESPKQKNLSKYPVLDNLEAVYFIFGMVFVCGFVVLSYQTFNTIWLILCVIYGLCLYAYVVKQMRLQAERRQFQVQLFAQDNNYRILDDFDPQCEAAILRAGNKDHNTQLGLAGRLHDYPIALFWHNFSTGIGRYETPHYYGVVEITLPKELPHIFIDDYANDGFHRREPLDVFNYNQEIKLEGNFSDYFGVYGIKGKHIDTLTILNPAFMSALLRHPDNFDVECVGNKVYIYCLNERTISEPSVKRLLTNAEFLVLELQKQLDTFTHYSPKHKQNN